jgi:NitT/TauT family transport system ATP-binding protein/nitrate/nitrite transport system substrate-binding protein
MIRKTDKKLSVKIGFIPLTDSAPLIVAKEMGFFSEFGLDVQLLAQHSWSTLRDKLHAGLLDAAQLLAPMPIASTLGLSGPPTKVLAPMVLSLNGNAITLSNELYKEVLNANEVHSMTLPMASYLLNNVVENRKKSGKPKLRFASVFPYSCHHYQLIEWLRSAQLTTDDIDLIVIPPNNMVDALHCGDIDGYCVGGPWNAKAVRAGFGITVLTSYDIWRDSPEKVLGVLDTYYQESPEQVAAICKALKKACEWLEYTPNRFEAARALSSYEYLDAPIDVIAPSLIGSCLVKEKMAPRHVPGYNQFYCPYKDINIPTHASGEWLLRQMVSTGQVSKTKAEKFSINSVFRSDIYQEIFQF